MGDILRICMSVLGVILFLKAIISLAKRKMTDQFCMVWALLGIVLILGGIFLNPSRIEQYISRTGVILIGIAVLGLIWGLWFISNQISSLARKNQELAIQVALLNHEYDAVLKKMENMFERLEETIQPSDK